jgi:hypothetical protein
MRSKVFLMTLVLLGSRSLAPAWDSPGHEQIADMAYSLLSPAAKQQIWAVLSAGDPQFAPHSDSEFAFRTSFRKSATFPDYIKTKHDTIYEPLVDEMNVKWQPHFNPHTTDNEAFRCKTWHYYDTAIRFSPPAPPARESNALVMLNYARTQISQLQSQPHPDRKMQCWWLYWIEHVIGDLHQPLHCAESYEFSAGGDAGGNGFDIQLTDAEGSPMTMRLHMYWDSGIDHAKTREKLTAQNPPPDFSRMENVSKRWLEDGAFAPSDAERQNLDPAHWIQQGATLADSVVYKGIEPNGTPDSDYNAKQEKVCKEQAILAAYRLAAVLESVFH